LDETSPPGRPTGHRPSGASLSRRKIDAASIWQVPHHRIVCHACLGEHTGDQQVSLHRDATIAREPLPSTGREERQGSEAFE